MSDWLFLIWLGEEIGIEGIEGIEGLEDIESILSAIIEGALLIIHLVPVFKLDVDSKPMLA